MVSSSSLRRLASLVPALLLAASAAFAAVPPDLAAALKSFRTDGPRGWSFTQTTAGGGESRVERFDAARPEFERWELLQQDGRPPTGAERAEYHEKQSRRSRGGTAPLLTDQLDLGTAELVAESPERATYRCRLKPGEEGDATARHLVATLVVHRPSATVERLELASTGPFSPTFGVRIAELRTTLEYSLPVAGRPSLPTTVSTRLRGRAFWLKSLDADLAVAFSDYEKAHR